MLTWIIFAFPSIEYNVGIECFVLVVYKNIQIVTGKYFLETFKMSKSRHVSMSIYYIA